MPTASIAYSPAHECALSCGTETPSKSYDHVWARFRRNAEEASFLSNTLLVLIATVALVAAFRQAIHARKGRMFEAFDRIQAKWDRPEIEATKNDLFSLEREMLVELRAAQAPGPSVPERIAEKLQSLRETQPAAYGSYWALLCLIEEIGLLSQSGYVDLTDIKNSIGTSLGSCTELLIPHIAWRRSVIDKRPNVWANLIWLHETLPRVPVRTVRGYGL